MSTPLLLTWKSVYEWIIKILSCLVRPFFSLTLLYLITIKMDTTKKPKDQETPNFFNLPSTY